MLRSWLTQEKVALEQLITNGQSEKAASLAKQDGLSQQLQEKQARIDELHRQNQQTQANLEHYRESAREQRLLDQQQHENQKQQLQHDIKTLNEQLVIQREKEFSLQQQHQTLQQVYTGLEKNQAEIKSQYHQLAIEFQETEKAKNEHKYTSVHWQKQHADLQRVLEEKNNLFIDAQTEIKLLSQQLTDTRQIHIMTEDQNKLLSHEKWVIAQEKAQLEGQLKQLQKMITS